ncbi:hypothetical protein [Actinocorallia aurantiaca]|uniref:Molecular chaperone DnaJ n=1 Tax=Actinocorallia aurantiaca TaxID=46204 RepID=A0ABN3UMZ5_9ACTN
MPAQTCTRCGGSGRIGKKKTFNPATGKPVRTEPIPCPDCA